MTEEERADRLARRRRRRVILALTASALVASATAIQMALVKFEAPDFGTRLLFFVLLNVNVLALVGLAYFVGKSIYRLALERRRGIVGNRIKTKVVAIFLVLIAAPLTLMFIVSSELGTNYIDRFFSPQFRQPIESSLKAAGTLYEHERDRVIEFARVAREGHELPAQYTVRVVRDQAEAEASAAVEAAFEGREETEVISSEQGDIIRAALPIKASAPLRGVIVVEAVLPQVFSESVNDLRKASEDFMHLEAWRMPIKMNYLMLLAFFTLMIVLSSIWVALIVANWMVEPVKSLALATAEVAAGNFSVRVEGRRGDELGMLIESFNNMVREIREGKDSLQQAYVNLENIIRNIQSGVITIDASGLVQSMNQASSRILGLKPSEMIGHHYHLVLDAMESETMRELIKGINLRTLKEVDREVWVRIGGRKVLLRIVITGLRGSAGEHLGILVVLDDITDVIKVQRALAWQEVARRMAHEIKNPLTPIKLSAERMRRKWENKSEDFGETFDRSTLTIIREVDSLKRMVDEFSKFGKLPEIKLKPTPLGDVIGEVAALYRDYRDLEFRVRMPGDPPVIDLDQAQFRRVLINLVDNALEAMRQKGTVTVSLTTDAERGLVLLSVADEGPGVPGDDRERLFQPYYSTKQGGTGLGLAIVDKIVAEHGGTIHIEDNPEGRGSVFVIELPYDAAAPESGLNEGERADG